MTDYSENGESPVSDSRQKGEKLFDAVEETIEDWIAEESIDVAREGEQIVADEDELVKNISFMIAIAVDEAGK